MLKKNRTEQNAVKNVQANQALAVAPTSNAPAANPKPNKQNRPVKRV